jgi:hypothetical protein
VRAAIVLFGDEMNKFATISSAIALTMSMSVPVMAETLNPEGLWTPGNKESRYEISYCGKGTDLCAKISWVDPRFVNDDNRKLLGTNLFSEIPMRGRNKWRGTINFQGYRVNGTVKQLSGDKLSVKACLLFLCEEVLLDRVAAH